MVNGTDTTTIRYANHLEPVDLTGRDVMSILGKTKSDVVSSIGLDFSGGSTEIALPSQKITSMTGEIADEVHEWPSAKQGSSFRSLSLHFRGGLLIAIEWNFSLKDFLPSKAPWYRRWL